MNIAILESTLCVNAAVFSNIETAQEFFELGVWPDADAIAELPDGFGIGDYYKNGEWTKAPAPPEPEPGPPPPDPQADLDALTVDHEYRLTLLELGVT